MLREIIHRPAGTAGGSGQKSSPQFSLSASLVNGAPLALGGKQVFSAHLAGRLTATMRAVIYGRVSTDRQTHDSQLAELSDYAARRGWPQPAEFLDVASGGKRERAGLDKLLGEVRRGRVDVLLCFRLDRLARSLAHLAQLIEELQVHRVALVVPGQGIDTTAESPAARFQLSVLGAVAELERGMIVERVRAGLAVARAKGTRLGRPARVNAQQRATVAELLAQGVGVRETGRRLELPPSTVRFVRDGANGARPPAVTPARP